VIVHKGLVYVGLSPREYVTLAGEETTVDLLTVDWDGEPVPGQTLAVEVVERRWSSVQEEDENGRTVWTWEVEEIDITSGSVTTDENGQAEFTFVPPTGGVFKVTASTRDEEGNRVISSAMLWVSSSEYVSWRQQNSNRIDLVNRRFQFWDALQESEPLSVTTQGEAIERIVNDRGEDVPIFRLDPLLIGSIFPIHGEDRIIVKPEEVSPLLPAALKVVEDRDFDSHIGVDFGAILRAAVVNLRAGHIEQGGSTLTQQLVKSYFLDNRRTFGRKIEEALMSMLLEVHFGKHDLMNAYINEIYLGQDGRRAIHGFGLASQFYFGKPLAELQLHEVALLVAVVRGPSYYDPRGRVVYVSATYKFK
jgi:hypothetical protein